MLMARIMMDHSTRNERILAGDNVRSDREARAKRRGRTYKQAYELRSKAAKSAAICGECFQPLAPTDSVTMESRKIANKCRVRVPVCLLCTLDNMLSRQHWFRTRCLNCSRPLRLYPSRWRPSWWHQSTCCADCERLARNERNN